MPRPCPLHDRHRRPLPRARIDRIDSVETALDLLANIVSCPPVPQTVVVGLDPGRRGRSILVVDGSLHPDSVLDAVDSVVASRRDEPPRNAGEALLAASVRPGGQVLDSDIDRWLEASWMTDAVGIELVEWFVIGERITCPRDLLGERPRWTQRLAS